MMIRTTRHPLRLTPALMILAALALMFPPAVVRAEPCDAAGQTGCPVELAQRAPVATPTPRPTAPPVGVPTAPPLIVPDVTSAPAPGGALTEADIAGKAGPSIVLIDTASGRGSGVKVAQGIITNEHVVSGATRVDIIRSDGVRGQAVPVKCDPRADLVLLQTDLDLPALDLGQARSHRQGDPVLVMGYPLSTRLQGPSSTLTRGLISAIRTDERGFTEIQTDAAINGGNSGGAMLNMQGRLIGIPYYRYARAQGISFAISSEAVQGLLDSPGLPCPSVSAPGTVLLSDDFANRISGYLPLISPVPSAFTADYVDGEYDLSQTNPNFPLPVYAHVPGAYVDTTLEVDARLVDPIEDRLLLLGCRDEDYDLGGSYVALFDTETGEAAMAMVTSRGIVPLTDVQESDAFQPAGESNRISLTCVGDRISMSVNGVEIISVNDGTYTDGGLWVGAYALDYVNVEARFDNLVVTQR